MSPTNLCRLCVKVSTSYNSLYNETGQPNKICEIALKYFHPMFLAVYEALDIAVLCSECCHRISDFYDFQQTIFKEQRRLLDGETEIEFELKTKMCEEVLLDDITNSKEELTVTHNIKKEDYQVIAQNANEPAPQCENPKQFRYNDEKINVNNADSEQSEDPASKSDHNQSSTPMKRKRKQRAYRKDLDAVISQWKPSIECVICKKAVPSFTSLRQHFEDEHPKERCYVKCCRRRFYLRWKLEVHARFHLYPYTFKCKICDSCHASKSALHLHVRTMNCLKRKDNTSPHVSVKTHSHNKNKFNEKLKTESINNFLDRRKLRVQCVLCTVPYSNFTELKQHFRQKHATEWCYALCCQQKFYRRSTFEQHVQLHLDENVAKSEIPASP